LFLNFLNRSRRNKWQRPDLFIKLRNVLNLSPKEPVYYELALTHRSASIHQTKGFSLNNERLEFLGDSILNAVVSDYLFHLYPNENEGFLTQLKSKLVSRAYLNDASEKIGLISLIQSQTRMENTNIPGNVLEAFTGAVYLDLGFDSAKEFVINRIIGIADMDVVVNTETNYKGKAIDWVQKNHHTYTFETFENEKYPSEGEKKFISYFIINNEKYGCGAGDSKKEAEQIAAKEACERIFKNN